MAKGDSIQKSRLCSVVSKTAGDDPAGSGSAFDGYLGIEIPPPWERDVTESKHFPGGLRESVKKALEAGAFDKFTALLPDPEYSREGHARVLYMRRPNPGPFAAYDKREYLAPVEELASLVEALPDPDALARFEAYRQDTSGVRDVLVCTHGSRDVCCGKFGYPIYEVLRYKHAAANPSLRVWRTSHIGGHRFAPTFLEFPEGRYWGHLEVGAAEGLAARRGSFSEIGRFYRGWAGFGSRFEQIAEREVLNREGWAWFAYLKEGRVLDVNADETRAEVRIDYRSPDGSVSGAYTALVEATGSVMTLASSGTDPLEEVWQYRVAELRDLPQKELETW